MYSAYSTFAVAPEYASEPQSREMSHRLTMVMQYAERLECTNALTSICAETREYHRLSDWLSGASGRIMTFLIYRCIEKPVRKLAWKIARSGQWGY